MSIINKDVYTDEERRLGQVPAYDPRQRVTTIAAEEDITFGMAMMVGTTPEQAKAYAGASGDFAGVARFSVDGSGVDSDNIIQSYEQYDDAGSVEEGAVVVHVTEAVTPASPVRIWHTEEVGTQGYQTVEFSAVKSGASATGLTNDGTTYTASISIDGTPNAVSVVGSASQTITNLITEIDADLTGAAVTIVAGDLQVTSTATGATSIIAITDTDLFSSLTDYSAIATAVPGTDDPIPLSVSNFCTTAVANKTTLLAGAKFRESTTAAGKVYLELGGLTNMSVTADT